MNDIEKALLGALEMLDGIAHYKTFSALEYYERLNRYKNALLAAFPSLKDDAYYGKLFNKE